MATCRLAMASVLILVYSCAAQGKPDPILGVLKKTDASGSIAYWSPGRKCGPDHTNPPPLPEIRAADTSRTVVDGLRGMFANDPKMGVTLEPGAFGKVRMFESDVPTDLLDLKIHHISFSDGQMEPTGLGFRGKKELGGSRMPISIILAAPEVQAFVKANHIELTYYSSMPSNIFALPEIHGNLEDLTLSEALDYAVSSHGYWLYGNCMRGGGRREVFIWFYAYNRWE
jgi:hypothetical protein